MDSNENQIIQTNVLDNALTACVGDDGAGDSVGSPGCLKTSQSNDSFSHQMSSLTLNPNEPEIENNVLDQNSALQNNRPRFSLNDLNLETTVGAGTFGRVELVRDKRCPEKYYALKKMRIKSVINLKQVSHVLSERAILFNCDCPYIVKLYWTWRDNVNLFLLMEYVPGGELFTHLRSQRKFHEQTSIFYAAEIVYAFIYLHNKSIIYRDLKPENVLITTEGHIKLTDFGFAKRIQDRTWTLCGTPEYLSPEVILNRGHGRAVDWWSLGILIYEMLVGQVPFVGENAVQIYENIIRGQIDFPQSVRDAEGDIQYIQVSPWARDIITGLLKVDRTRRLGNMRNGAQDVQNHPWFCHVNWEDIAEQKMQPPMLPYVQGPGDPSNFEEYDPEDPVTPDEVYDEEYLMMEFGDFKYTCDAIEEV